MLSSCIQIVVKIIIIMVTLYIACFLQGLALKSYETYILVFRSVTTDQKTIIQIAYCLNLVKIRCVLYLFFYTLSMRA
jgi:hypothetical protein